MNIAGLLPELQNSLEYMENAKSNAKTEYWQQYYQGKADGISFVICMIHAELGTVTNSIPL